MTAFADYEFAPWTVADGKRVVAPEAEWDRVCTLPPSRIHVPVDVFEDCDWPMVDSKGRRLWCPRDGRRNDEFIPEEPGWSYFACRPLTMSDVRVRTFGLMDKLSHLTWLVSTEHTADIARMTPGIGDCPDECTPLIRNNLWLGARITDNRTADERIPHLLETPAAVRWLDITPTDDIDLMKWIGSKMRCLECGKEFDRGDFAHVAWHCFGHEGPEPEFGGVEGIRLNPILWAVIRGGDPVHIRSLRDQCRDAGVPFWCEPAIDGVLYREFPTVEQP